MPFPAVHENTKEVMENPQVGDRFSEMFSFWVYVIERGKDHVVILEASAPCKLPEEGKITTYTLAEFKQRFSYGSIPGYWINYIDSNNDVEGWF